MKRNIFTLLIVVSILIVFSTLIFASEETMSAGELWNRLSDSARLYFILGFAGGLTESVSRLVLLPLPLGEVPPEFVRFLNVLREIMDLKDFVWEHYEVVKAVIDNLYKDPANTYITFSPIIKIACHKLKGEDIELLLQEARKKALP